MNKQMKNRRDFIKKCGLSTVPFLLPPLAGSAESLVANPNTTSEKTVLNFIYDGLSLSPQAYLEKLHEINAEKSIEPDFYGNGGATTALEKEFAARMGKEKAIYLPSGTMANQLAISLLNGNKTKVIVPENSHVYRDEADAAQSVHGKRLIPLGKGKPFYDLKDLEATIAYSKEQEVFRSGLGTVVIEHPIRRADNTAVPISTIKEVSDYCRTKGYKLHLDGSRLHLAAAFTGVPVADYAAYFDTVYISLYKYLNATGGAILCGDAAIINQVSHQIKIFGGTTFQTWGNTAVAMHYLHGIEERLETVVGKAKELIAALNEIKGITIEGLENGTNVYNLSLDPAISLKKLANFLYQKHAILVGRADENGMVKFTLNESLLTRNIPEIVAAWKAGIKESMK